MRMTTQPLIDDPANLIATALSPVEAGDADVDMEVLRSIPEQFAITDENTANWLVRKIIASREYGKHVKEWAEREARRAEREEHTLLFLFGRQIETWTKDQIATLNGKRKSIPLPAGMTGFRTVSSKLVIDDERTVMAWARRNCPNAIVVVEKVMKSIIDDHVKSTGELPDGGIHVEPPVERFFIK